MNDEIFAEIALEQIGISTLKVRSSDDLDFYRVAVWEIHEAMRSAYLAGYAAAIRAARGKEAPLPNQRHAMRNGVWLGEGEATDFGDDPRVRVVTTLPIHETGLTAYRWQERHACNVLIPLAIRQRRID